MPASEYRALQDHVAELQPLLGKKTMEAERLREAVSQSAGPKLLLRLDGAAGFLLAPLRAC